MVAEMDTIAEEETEEKEATTKYNHSHYILTSRQTVCASERVSTHYYLP